MGSSYYGLLHTTAVYILSWLGIFLRVPFAVSTIIRFVFDSTVTFVLEVYRDCASDVAVALKPINNISTSSSLFTIRYKKHHTLCTNLLRQT